ncbi:MAG: class I SAM-dependent methyltransferase [Myxococcales bacterium]
MESERHPGAQPTLRGVIELQGARIPVELSFASRLSLYAAFETDVADRTVFGPLRLELDGREVELGATRLHREYTRAGAAGRLVFLDDVYDCQALLFQKKLVNLKGFFQSLPLVLAQKQEIRPAFREYVSDALYDLAVYKRFFNEQDRILANEPRHVAAPAQEALIRTEGRAFLRFFDGQLARLDALVAELPREQYESHGYYLRRMAWEYILGSEFLKRTNLKPRGYAGDAEMMRMCYENAYVGDYVFNKLLHKHPLETPAAQAVRNRRVLVPRVLREAADRFPREPEGGFRLFSVACGPAWELQDIYVGADDFRRFSCTLLDQDPDALEAARAGIRRIEAERNGRVRATFLNDSVRTMLRTRDLQERFGRFHFIYSMGLFDYLTPPVARVVLSKLYALLEPGGTLLVGNYHVKNPTRHYMAYWMDWQLYYRSETDFLELAAPTGAAPSIELDPSGCQMFLQLRKDG